MRVLKIMLLVFVVCLVGAVSLSCKAKVAQVPENQTATVQRGDLTIDITGTGNLVFSHKEDIAFEMAGTVEEVSVKVGDTVETGEVLAKLDTSQWEDQLTTLQNQLTAAQRQVVAKQRALLQTQINLKNAETAVQKAEMFTTTDPTDLAIKRLQLQIAQGGLEDAQTAIDDANEAVVKAQKALDEAKALKPTITAPFTGLITMVNVSGGSEVKKGTVAVTLADPTKFEAQVLVSQTDIFQVKIGGDASVQVDAMPTLSLPAKVTYISPTATIQQGVVNYKVTVELQSLQPVLRSQSGQSQRPQLGASSQTLPALTQATQLKEGLSVTISIIIAQRSNVLLVSNRAISRSGKETLVKVLENGVAQSRSIKTGLSNGQYSEVTEGLSEGEKVVIPQTTTSTSTTSTQGGGIPFIPGMGGR